MPSFLQKLNLLLSIPVVKGLIRKKIKAGLGLTECKIALTGAAPISADLLEFFKKLGIEIMEVYGMTENFVSQLLTSQDKLNLAQLE